MDYKFNLDVDPTNKYEKAMKDWIQFQQSFNELSEQEKNRLFVDIRDNMIVRQMLNLLGQGFC